MSVQAYALSLAIGIVVGVLYGVLNTRSPAPPIIALLGLLGMLLGETAVSWAKTKMSAQSAAAECLHAKSFANAKTDEQETKA